MKFQEQNSDETMKLEIRNKFELSKCWNDKNGKLAAAVEAAN